MKAAGALCKTLMGAGFLLGMWGVGSGLASAQADAPTSTIQAVMLSDLHLDPFHDPAKVPLLVKAPVKDWERILSAPDSDGQKSEFAAVQKACKAKQSMDSPYALMRSSLDAAKSQSPHAKFVMVSGDLLVHDLDCRYRAALHLPPAAGDDESLSASFAEKTSVFVIEQIEAAFAGVPVYMALGNNDSRCNHNRLDMHDEFLKATAEAVIDGLRGVSAKQKKSALATYDAAGYYAVTMAAPMRRTRLLVVDDIYMMSKFANCEASDNDRAGAEEQTAWLNKEMDSARKRGESVWVLGHLPPAVNPKSAARETHEFCASGEAEPYLASGDLADALISHADVVRLGIFGHTHMDELHLLGTADAGVPIKVVGSVSPVSGNLPSFTVAQVEPRSATLMDYTVFEASNMSGEGTSWKQEYRFDETYGETSFTAKSLSDLIGRFRLDSAGKSAESRAYQQYFFKGSAPAWPRSYWAAYVCSFNHATPEGFKACLCAGK